MKAKLVTLPIDEIIPYWRNPRDNNDMAVQMVVDSIGEYGYQAPIIVDTKKVIILGHTRYKALRKIGIETVDVLISDLDETQAREYRVVDNKTTEYSNWLIDNLLAEYQELPPKNLLRQYFPQLRQDGTKAPEAPQNGSESVPEAVELQDGDFTEILCVHCYSGFELTWKEAKELLNGKTTG